MSMTSWFCDYLYNCKDYPSKCNDCNNQLKGKRSFYEPKKEKVPKYKISRSYKKGTDLVEDDNIRRDMLKVYSRLVKE